jgi:hypothetical protein
MLKKTCLLLVIMSFSFVILVLGQNTKPDSSIYFPQNVGDEHIYRKIGKLAKPNDSWTDKITEKSGRFFSHSNFWGDGVSRSLKMNNKSSLIEKAKDKKFIWYKFSEEAQWTMNLSQEGVACSEGARVKITSRTDTVEVPAGTFQNCLKLQFSTNCNDAGIVEQWFAPNVGLIKQTEETIAGLLTTELVKAKIADKNYPAK